MTLIAQSDKLKRSSVFERSIGERELMSLLDNNLEAAYQAYCEYQSALFIWGNLANEHTVHFCSFDEYNHMIQNVSCRQILVTC